MHKGKTLKYRPVDQPNKRYATGRVFDFYLRLGAITCITVDKPGTYLYPENGGWRFVDSGIEPPGILVDVTDIHGNPIKGAKQ